MNRIARLSLTAAAALVGFACQDGRTPTSPPQTPALEIRDGFSDGNPHYFFVFPIRAVNLQPPNTAPFNPDLAPVVDICEWDGSTCVQQISHLTMSAQGLLDRVFVLPQAELYLALWRTDQLQLSANKIYRISVLVGTRVLGFADVDVVKTLWEAAQVDRDEFVPLLKNQQGGSVVLATTGDRVDIPAQTSGQVVTVTLHPCSDPNGLGIDLPKFGNCLTVTADPPLAAALSPPATVSICSLHDNIPALVHAQQDLVALHRQDITPDATLISALPHSTDFCPRPIGAAPLPPARNWMEAGWRAVRHGVASLFGVRPLHAATAMLDVGGGGETPVFSDFQFALPAKMTILTGAVQRVLANTAVPIPPAVLVTDANDRPVGGARVHFRITSTNGGSITPTDGIALSDPVTGLATLTSWQVGDPGDHSVDASGFGIADPQNNGPAEGFDPFAPAVFPGYPDQDKAQPEVPLSTGHLTFSATALAPLLVRPVTSGFASAAGLVLPLTQANGLSMQSGTGVLLDVSPTTAVAWSSSDPLGTVGSVNTTGLVAVVQGNDDPAVAHELVVTATGTGATGAMKINSYAFDHFPRFTTLVWRPVVGAVSYDVQYEFGNGCTSGTAVCTTWAPHSGSPAATSSLGYVFEFVGGQPGRWRVVAHDVLGGILSTSEWVYFNYLH